MDQYSSLFATAGLSLDRLRTLVLLAEAGSLTAAASGDTTRVSLFSRQLRELEAHFGTRLARRQGRKLTLTSNGLRLAEAVRNHFRELQDFAAACKGEPAEVVLGAGASVVEWMLVPRFASLRRSLKAYRIKLVRESSETLAQRLCERRLDVAILREDAVTGPLRTVPFASFGYALFVPRALAGPPRLLHEWLPRTPMVSPTRGWSRTRVDEAVTAAGLRLRVEIDGASATLAVRTLRTGEFAAILPEIAAKELAGCDVAVLRPPFLRAIERRLVVAWHPRQAESRSATLAAVDALRGFGGASRAR